ncbi:MAG: carbonic anhydrase family protein [Saonia sp.]
MKKIFFTTAITSLMLITTGHLWGQEKKASTEAEKKNETSIALPKVESVMTLEDQKELTPEEVLNGFMEGNWRFVKNDLTARDHSEQVRRSVKGQYPKAIVLSCVDSRVPVEDVFDKGIGDIFVARVAGNFVNGDILGSMEFASKVAGAKLIMIMGHENCGAIHAAIDKVELGNITAMLKNVAPAIEMSANFEGEKSSKNPKYVHLVSENNVLYNISKVKEQSSILKEMAKTGEIDIVGAIYDMDTGVVNLLEPQVP